MAAIFVLLIIPLCDPVGPFVIFPRTDGDVPLLFHALK
jgi:hypothetical protein